MHFHTSPVFLFIWKKEIVVSPQKTFPECITKLIF